MLSPFTPTINNQLSATRRDYSFSARNNCNSVTVPCVRANTWGICASKPSDAESPSPHR